MEPVKQHLLVDCSCFLCGRGKRCPNCNAHDVSNQIYCRATDCEAIAAQRPQGHKHYLYADQLSDLPTLKRPSTMIKLAVSNICSAFDAQTIGSKVWATREFYRALTALVEQHDFTKDRVPGQAVLEAPGLVPFVQSGVGRRSQDPSDYVCRSHRGIVSSYLKREFAEPVESCLVVVYTMEAYLQDPDVSVEEHARLAVAQATHVIVAVIAHAGPNTSPLPPYRLVWNLAGGNREALLWTADEIREKARLAIRHDLEWATVAD